MIPEEPLPTARSSHLRGAALVAGMGLLLMTILAALANLAVLSQLPAHDPARTAAQLAAMSAKFELAIAGLFLTAILDVVVAWALWVFFARVQPVIALLAAWCRTIYAVIFAVAIAQLVAAARLLPGAGPEAATSGLGQQLSTDIQRFHDIWSLGLGLFGLHLLLISALAWRSAAIGRIIAVLVAVAGAGYLIDSVSSRLSGSPPLNVAAVTFIGEIVLTVRLLIDATRRSPNHDQTTRTRVSAALS